MTAIEFVKECGINVAKRTLSNAVGFGCSEIELFGGKYTLRTDDLKQIVEAFELVYSFGGLVMAKNCEYSEELDHVRYNVGLAKAIELVEKCNASD